MWACCSFPHFLHHTDGLVTSGLGWEHLTELKGLSTLCLSAGVPRAFPFRVRCGPPERPNTTRILKGRDSSSPPSLWFIYLGSYHSPCLEVPTLWHPLCLTSLAQTLGFLLNSHSAFSKSLEPLSALPLQSSGQIGTTGKE